MQKTPHRKIWVCLVSIFLSLSLACGCFLIINKFTPNSTPSEEQPKDEGQKEGTKDWKNYGTAKLIGAGTENVPWEISSADDFAFLSDKLGRLEEEKLCTRSAVVKALAGEDIEEVVATAKAEKSERLASAMATAQANGEEFSVDDFDEGYLGEKNYFKLTSNIDMSGYRWNPIPNLNGNLDGGNHIIDIGSRTITDEDVANDPNAYIDSENNLLIAPFRGENTASSNIKIEGSLTVDINDEIHALSLESGTQQEVASGSNLCIGGCFATTNQFIDNIICYVNVSYTINKDKNFNTRLIGGIVGFSSGIQFCVYSGNINVQVAQKDGPRVMVCVGGIAGLFGTSTSTSEQKTIADCSNYGEINIDTERSSSLSTYYIGGIVAYISCGVLDTDIENKIHVANGDVLSRCVNFGDIECHRTVDEARDRSIFMIAGGLIGRLDSKNTGGTCNIRGCVNIGWLDFSDCWVYGTFDLGGICGEIAIGGSKSTGVYSCYNYGKINGKSNNENFRWLVSRITAEKGYTNDQVKIRGDSFVSGKVGSRAGTSQEYSGYCVGIDGLTNVSTSTSYGLFNPNSWGDPNLGYDGFNYFDVPLDEYPLVSTYNGKPIMDGFISGLTDIGSDIIKTYLKTKFQTNGESTLANENTKIFVPVSALSYVNVYLQIGDSIFNQKDNIISPSKYLQRVKYNYGSRNEGEFSPIIETSSKMIFLRGFPEQWLSLIYPKSATDQRYDITSLYFGKYSGQNYWADPTEISRLEDLEGLDKDLIYRDVLVNGTYTYGFFTVCPIADKQLSGNYISDYEQKVTVCLRSVEPPQEDTKVYFGDESDDLFTQTDPTLLEDAFKTAKINNDNVLLTSRETKMLEDITLTIEPKQGYAVKGIYIYNTDYTPGMSLNSMKQIYSWNSGVTGAVDLAKNVRATFSLDMTKLSQNKNGQYKGTVSISTTVPLEDKVGIFYPALKYFNYIYVTYEKVSTQVKFYWRNGNTKTELALKDSPLGEMNTDGYIDWTGSDINIWSDVLSYASLNNSSEETGSLCRDGERIGVYLPETDSQNYVMAEGKIQYYLEWGNGNYVKVNPNSPNDIRGLRRLPQIYVKKVDDGSYVPVLVNAKFGKITGSSSLQRQFEFWPITDDSGRVFVETYAFENLSQNTYKETIMKGSYRTKFEGFSKISFEGETLIDIYLCPTEDTFTIDITDQFNRWDGICEYIDGNSGGETSASMSDNWALSFSSNKGYTVKETKQLVFDKQNYSFDIKLNDQGEVTWYRDSEREYDKPEINLRTFSLEKLYYYFINVYSENNNDFVNALLSGTLNDLDEKFRKIPLFVQYSLQTYSFNGTVEGDGSVSLDTYRDNQKNEQTFNSGDIFYYEPVVLTASPNNNKNFVGYFLETESGEEKFLSNDKEFHFYVNPYSKQLTSPLKIIARFEENSEGETGKGTAPNKVNGIYQITSANNLVWLSYQVANGSNFANEKFVLANDIDMKDIVFTPIGTSEHPFAGFFDGNFHTISNLKTFESDLNNSQLLYGRGMFGYTDGATIQNFVLVGGQVTGYGSVGAVVGMAKNSTFRRVENYSLEIVASEVSCYDIYGKPRSADYDRFTIDDEKVQFNSDNLHTPKAIIQSFFARVFGGLVGNSDGCTFVGCSNRAGVTINDDIVSFGGLLGNVEGMTSRIDQCFTEGLGYNLVGEGDSFEISYSYSRNGSTWRELYGRSKTDSGLSAPDTWFNQDYWIKLNGKYVLKIFYW